MISTLFISYGQQQEFYNPATAAQTTKPTQNVAKALFWSEDFANGLNSTNGTWTQSGTDQIWKHSFYTTSGEWSTGTPAFASTTSANGFMLYDADSLNFTVTPNYLDRNGALISPSIDCSGQATVTLNFEANARYCCADATGLFTVSVSNDGGSTWTDYQVMTALAANAASANPEMPAVDISAVAGNQANVMLRFNFGSAGNSHYYWIVDDIWLDGAAAANPPVATSTATAASCNGDCDGSATAVATGGTPGYTYLWDDPTSQTTDVATGLCAGTYTCIVTDNLGDTTSTTVTVTEPTAVVATGSSTDATIGNSDGTATAVASGGTAGYTYLWDDASAQTTATATGLPAGVYICTVTDANGCTFPLTVIVEETLGINDLIFGVVSISPNPSTDVFNISFSQAITGKTTMQVMNLAGQVVESVELGELSDAKTVSIDARKWATGTYLLQLSNNGVTSNSVKIV